VGILLGNGQGSFTSVAAVALTWNPGALALADFDKDGKADLAVGDPSSFAVRVLHGNGDATFGASTAIVLGMQPTAITAGDVDADGNADLVVVIQSAPLQVQYGDGKGGFNGVSYSIGQHVSTRAVLADVNGDTHLDLFVFGGDDTILLRSLGGRTFAAGQSTGGYGYTGVVGDWNRDGRLDFATTVYAGLAVVMNTSP
jgi:hypothetical protein